MRRLAIATAAVALWSSVALAQPISRLPPAGPVSPTDLIVIDQLRPTSEQTSSPYGTFHIALQDLGIGGGGVTARVTNGTASTIPAGSAVYISGSDTVSLAVASTFATSGVIGLATKAIAAGASEIITAAGFVTLSTGEWDAVTGQVGGLTINGLYFLSPFTAGYLTTVPPTTPGQCNVLIGRALSSTTLLVAIQPPILL